MSNSIYICIGFAMGAALGACGAWYYAKKKYEEIAQDEIDSVKEVFSRKSAEFHDKEMALNIAENMKKTPNVESDIAEGTAILHKNGYISDAADREVDNKPYIITPDQFMENEDYDSITLTHYADGVLADDADEPIADVDGTVGIEALNHFGEYEEDSVFVRNDARKTDYEILLDERTYEVR